MINLVDLTVLRCPYCKYVWNKRVERLPVSCPRCKKRFDYPGRQEELENGIITVGSPSMIRDWLDKANSFSKECDDMDEVLERAEHE